MTVEIRLAHASEWVAFNRMIADVMMAPATADPEALAEFRRQVFARHRCWVGANGSQLVATAATFDAELTMPTAASESHHNVAVDALTVVTVSPTHRRQGILRRLMSSQLHDAKRRGALASILVAAEYPIYGRFGYGPYCDRVDIALDTRGLVFRTPGTGHVELVDDLTMRQIAPSIHDAARRARSGDIDRSSERWDVELQINRRPGTEPKRHFNGVCRDDAGNPIGYVRYHLTDDWTDSRRPNATATIVELESLSPGASARLWRFVSEVDWVATVVAEDRPFNDPLRTFLLDGRHVTFTGLHDFIWLRPLDPQALLAARSYRSADQLVIAVDDPDGLAHDTVEVDGATGRCERTTKTPDVVCTPGAFGSLVMGGGDAHALTATGDVRGDDGAVDRLHALLSWPTPPMCVTHF
ncbi:MAG: GNAT family N-acetyltransferase [Acidimicrobiia bacterium]